MSTKKRILILGNHHCEHAQHVYAELARRGAVVDYLDFARFPAEVAVSFDPAARAGSLRLPTGARFGLDEVAAVYWRNLNKPSLPPLAHPEQAYIAENDGRSLLETLLEEMPARWVNGWSGYLLHQRKPAALARVAALGVRIPQTIVTNDAAQLRAFAAEARFPLIFKPVQGGAHAQRLLPEHLSEANLQTLRMAPITAQEEIPGTNIRVFVAGDEVVACEVAARTLDFRDDPQAKIRPFALDPGAAQQSLRIARALELVWTGIDYRLTPDGELVYLEANPSPMFLGFERATGLPLTRLVCDLMIPTTS